MEYDGRYNGIWWDIYNLIHFISCMVLLIGFTDLIVLRHDAIILAHGQSYIHILTLTAINGILGQSNNDTSNGNTKCYNM